MCSLHCPVQLEKAEILEGWSGEGRLPVRGRRAQTSRSEGQMPLEKAAEGTAGTTPRVQREIGLKPGTQLQEDSLPAANLDSFVGQNLHYVCASAGQDGPWRVGVTHLSPEAALWEKRCLVPWAMSHESLAQVHPEVDPSSLSHVLPVAPSSLPFSLSIVFQ